jgi:hypothetical protein
MTRDEIIRMARHAGMFKLFNDPNSPDALIGESIEQFAALVAAAEREACAGLCDEIEKKKWETVMHGGEMQGISARDCAAAIRERGENK